MKGYMTPEEPWKELAPEQARRLLGEVLDKAAEEGATVSELGSGTVHVPGHSDSCTCDDCLRYAEHVCACFNCKPLLLPETPERLSSGHYGTRFGTDAEALVVFKEVEGELTKLVDVVEVEVEQGWALRVSQPVHLCRRCYKSVCLYKDKGEFAVAAVFTAHDESGSRDP